MVVSKSGVGVVSAITNLDVLPYKNGHQNLNPRTYKKGFGTKITGKKFLIILIVMFGAVKPTQTA